MGYNGNAPESKKKEFIEEITSISTSSTRNTENYHRQFQNIGALDKKGSPGTEDTNKIDNEEFDPGSG